MTDKQRNLLSKYLTEDRLKQLEGMIPETVSNFIAMILHYRWYHPVLGEMCNVPYLKRKLTETEESRIYKIIMANRSQLGLFTDEDVWVKEIRFLPNGKQWYYVEQRWYKGEANSPSTINRSVSATGDKPFEGIYNILFDSEIYSIDDLMRLYVSELQKHTDKMK